MNRKNVISLITVFIILSSFTFAQKYSIPDNLEQYIKIERLSDRVRIIRMGSGDQYETVTAIATKKGIVVIDAGMNAPVTEIYKRLIEKEFNRKDFIYLIYTHSHEDHIFGNRAFSGIEIIGQENGKKEILKKYKDNSYNTFWSGILKQNIDMYKGVDSNSIRGKEISLNIYRISGLLSELESNFAPPVPSIMFNDRMTLDMGDITIKLFYFGKAHTESDILIYIPEEKLLFTGDLFRVLGEEQFDYYSKENAEKWNSTLNEILNPAYDFKYIVNGHDKITYSIDQLKIFNRNVQKIYKGYSEGKELYNYDRVNKALEKNGYDDLMVELQKLRTTESNKYIFLERRFRYIGIRLLGQNKTKEAIEIFKMNLELFPESWYASDRLAEAYLKAGNNDLAIVNYEKSIKLNPKNTNAVEQLKKLK